VHRASEPRRESSDVVLPSGSVSSAVIVASMSATTPFPLAEWPEDGLSQVERCPACGAASRHLLYGELTDRTYRRAPGTWRLFRCGECASAYLDPRPDDRTVHLAYRDYYEGAVAPQPVNGPRGWGRLRRALRNGYLNTRYGYDLAPASRLGALIVSLTPRYREKADEVVRHLEARQGSRRLLDVGCGEGEFLATMQALGWSVEGIEPSADAVAVARARDVPVVQGTFADVALAPASFDAVTIRLVFEAFPDPVAVLGACRRALKAGGILWIASPSLESDAHRVFGSDWIFLDPPRHAVLYTPSALVRLVTRLGFSVVALRPSRMAPWSFRMSAALASGLSPFNPPAPPLPRKLALRARFADLRGLRRPELADVVVVIARKV
jgi:2-polyprenyl-3-methyl-5-hydroxy-6-metoxy-1,4-benzoquinol methylase